MVDQSPWRGFLDGSAVELPDLSSKIIRVFLSSTFSDMVVERNALMERVYPKLKEHCRTKYGLEFQVVDMRWGVTHEVQSDHRTSFVCTKEIENCQRLSVGPNFVALVGQKYGYRPFPPFILSDEFECLYSTLANSKTDTMLLDTWFKKDLNSIPPRYILQPINTILTNYHSQDEKLCEKDTTEWNRIFGLLQVLLRSAATLAFKQQKIDEDTKAKYFISVTEEEVNHGLMASRFRDSKCLCFIRTIEDLEDQLEEKKAQRFIDINSGKIDDEAQMLLKSFKEDKLTKKLTKRNVFRFSVKWCPELGIDVRFHEAYLKSFCDIFFKRMLELIDQSQETSEAFEKNELMIEIIQHLNMRKSWCALFKGRDDVVSQIRKYIQASGQASQPFIIYGESGSGKTAVIAQCSRLTSSWIRGKTPAVITRFLGTTPQSSSIHQVLTSICQQITALYGADSDNIPPDFNLLINHFQELLKLATEQQPLLLYLDSLDQLSLSYNPQKLHWFPTFLPPHVKLVVTTLPNAHNLLETLQKKVPQPEHYLQITSIGDSLSLDIVMERLRIADRTITREQQQILVDLFKACSLPLFSKIIFDEICSWRSYNTPSDSSVGKSIQVAISLMFDRLELTHGHVLVKHSLAYLTAARNGLTEVELEDLLSLDDDVLVDVFSFWLPPIRRIPSALWTHLHMDLMGYIVEREADGVTIISWYHQQFRLVAETRYLTEPLFRFKIHSNLADYFSGVWGGGKKKPFKLSPFLIKRLLSVEPGGDADRKVPMQRLVYHSKKMTTYNRRKLSELPVHLQKSNRLQELRNLILYNYNWMYAKIASSSLQQLLADFSLALSRTNDESLVLLIHCLRISGSVLNAIPENLAFELSGRLKEYENVHAEIGSLLEQCKKQDHSALLSPFQCFDCPSGALLYSLEGGIKDVADACFVLDGMELVTVTWDGQLSHWDLRNGELIKRVRVDDIKPGSGTQLHVTTDSKYLVFCSSLHNMQIGIYELSTFDCHHCYQRTSTHNHHRMCVGKRFAVLDNSLVDIESGQVIHHFDDYINVTEFVCAEITPDDQHVIISCQKETTVFDIQTCRKIISLQASYIASAIKVTSSGTKAIVGQSVDCLINVFNIDESSSKFGMLLQTFDHQAAFQLTEDKSNSDKMCMEVSELFVTTDEKLLVSLIKRLYIIVWNMVNCDAMPTLMSVPPNKQMLGQRRYFYGASITNDGRYIVAVELSSIIYLWSTDSGSLLSMHPAHQGDIHRLRLSPCENVVITCARGDPSIKVWNLENLKDVGSLNRVDSYDNSVKNVLISSQREIAFVKHEYSVKGKNSYHYIDYFGIDVWDLASGTRRSVLSFGQYGSMIDFALSRDTSKMIIIVGDMHVREVRVLNLTTGQLVCHWPILKANKALISYSGQYVAVQTGDDQKTNTHVFEVKSGEELIKFQHSYDCCWLDGENILVAVTTSKDIHVYSPGTAVYKEKAAYLKSGSKLLPIPSQNKVAIYITSKTGDSIVKILEISTESLKVLKKSSIDGCCSSGIGCIADDGRLFIDQTLQIFDLTILKKLKKLRSSDHAREYKMISLTHKGRHVVWVDSSPLPCIKVCRIEDDLLLATCSIHCAPTSLGVVLPSNIVVVGGQDGHLYILHLKDSDIEEPQISEFVKISDESTSQLNIVPVTNESQEKLVQLAKDWRAKHFHFDINSSKQKESRSRLCQLM